MTESEAPVPVAIRTLAEERAKARLARDFVTADQLRAHIEAAGWKVVDDGADYTLSPARPADRREDGRLLFGSAASVPSRLEGPAAPGASVLVVLMPAERAGVADPLDACLLTAGGVRAALPPATDIVVVADGDAAARALVLAGFRAAAGIAPTEVDQPESPADGGGPAPASSPTVEVVWMMPGLGPAAALAAGARRAAREIVLVLAPGVVPGGEIVAPIAAALADVGVAAVGSEGLASTDRLRFHEAGPGDVSALGPACIAFRRSDADRLLGIDERLRSYRGAALWSSLALAEEGPGAGARGSRRLVALDLAVSPVVSAVSREAGPSDRSVRRDLYRIAARFGGRGDPSG